MVPKFCCPRIKSGAKTSDRSLARICIHYNTNSCARAARTEKKHNTRKGARLARAPCRLCRDEPVTVYVNQAHYHFSNNESLYDTQTDFRKSNLFTLSGVIDFEDVF